MKEEKARCASSADRDRFRLHAADTIKSSLERQIGQEVGVKLLCGEEVSGTVSKIGDLLIHLSALEGREHYDAAIRLDQISAVIVRVRGK